MINVLQAFEHTGTGKAVGFAKATDNLRLGLDERLAGKDAPDTFGLDINETPRGALVVTA